MLFCSNENRLSNEELIEALSQKLDHKTIKFLQPTDEDEMVETIADAFIDDPLFRWIANIPKSNPDPNGAMMTLIRWVARGLNRLMLNRKRGVMVGAMDMSDTMQGAMSIMPSSYKPAGDFGWIMYIFFQGGGLPPYEKTEMKENYGPWCSKRMDCLATFAQKRDEIMKPYPRFIYLQQIGVRCEHQGKGIGGRLYRALFDAADSLNTPVYLETESEENESLYHHYGFKTVETPIFQVEGDNSDDNEFKTYLMLRQPQHH